MWCCSDRVQPVERSLTAAPARCRRRRGRAAAALRSTSVSSPSVHGQRVVLARVEVGELVDPVEHVGDELLEEHAAGATPTLPPSAAGDRAGQLGDVGVVDESADPVRSRAAPA